MASDEQLEIPEQVRKALGLHDGDLVAFFAEDGWARIVPVKDAGLLSLRGTLKGPIKFTSIEDEDDAAAEQVVREYLGFE
jgi:bifunctional DNA-binding transcriptional regulator/antitoxin component of YhaV-PrlF toxin-antitoxin module